MDAVPTHMHLVALLGVFHVHAVAPRNVNVVVAVEHVDAAQPDAHLRLLAVGGPRLRSIRAARSPLGGGRRFRAALSRRRGSTRSSSRRRLRRAGGRRALGGAVDGLERHVVAHLVVHIQKLVERHAVELRECDEVVGVGRRLRALPLRHGLARHAQLLRERFLRQS